MKRTRPASRYIGGGPNMGGGSGFTPPGNNGPPPTISAGSQPWLGGTVISPDGTEWYINGAPMVPAQTGATYVVSSADCSVGDIITRYDSATGKSSGGLTVERVLGITRDASTDDIGFERNFIPFSTTTTFFFQVIISGGDPTSRILGINVRRTNVPVLRRGYVVQVDVATGGLQILTWDSAFGANLNYTSPTLILDQTGTVEYIGAVNIDFTNITLYLGQPGGVASKDTTTAPSISGITGATASTFFRQIAPATGSRSAYLEGTLSALELTTTINDADFDAVLAAGSLEAAGLFSNPALNWAVDPNGTQSQNTNITAGSQLIDPAFALIGGGGTTRIQTGLFNKPTTAPV